MDNSKPIRKRLRLKNYDYSSPGTYFVTVCTKDRKNTLSHIVEAIHESPAVNLTKYGEIVDRVINSIPSHLNTTLDSYVIMPNHIHLIIVVNVDAARSIHESPLPSRSVLSKVVGYIKMNASKEIHKYYGNHPIWQRGYFDHIIRDEKDYNKIAKYIYDNPARWQFDKLFSE